MKEKDPRKETAIFEATLDLVAEVGLTGLKMANIAKQAQIASGTLYLYFASKEDLLNALYRKLKTDEAALGTGDASSQLPLKLRIRQIWAKALQYRLDHYREGVFIEQFYRSPYVSEESKQVSAQATRYIFDLLAEGKQHLIFKPVADEWFICLLIGYLKEVVTHCRLHQLSLTPELIDTSFSLCWDAMKA